MMRAYFTDIWRGMSSHPARAGLSFSGIAVGTAALCMLLAVAGGLRWRARLMREEFGADVFALVQRPDESERQRPIQRTTVEHLRHNLPGSRVTGCEFFDVPAGGRMPAFRLVRADEYLLSVRPWKMTRGRFLDATDLSQRERSVVISRALAVSAELRVGDVMPIRREPFRVVGIVEAGAGTGLEAEAMDSRWLLGERVVFVPWTVAPHWIEQREKPQERLDVVFFRPSNGEAFQAEVTLARALMEQPDQQLADIEWVTPEQVTESIRQWQHLIEWTAGGIALLCLTLGGVTLMSLMVSNIQERIPEIGLRLSLGAGRADIALLFAGEALATSLLAGGAGAGMAFALLRMASARFPVPLLLNGAIFAWAVGVTVLLGALFSVWPALLAARISPAEALRND